MFVDGVDDKGEEDGGLDIGVGGLVYEGEKVGLGEEEIIDGCVNFEN